MARHTSGNIEHLLIKIIVELRLFFIFSEQMECTIYRWLTIEHIYDGNKSCCRYSKVFVFHHRDIPAVGLLPILLVYLFSSIEHLKIWFEPKKTLVVHLPEFWYQSTNRSVELTCWKVAIKITRFDTTIMWKVILSLLFSFQLCLTIFV